MSRLGGKFIAEVETIVRECLICQDIARSHKWRASLDGFISMAQTVS
jgi:hypothetical protein